MIRKIILKNIITTQALLWAAAIISSVLVVPSKSVWLLLTVLAVIALGLLKKGIAAEK
tara:strand:+ start:326 stop:499 length:174 start_codon:yes stop_codon:yes gene_type:complete